MRIWARSHSFQNNGGSAITGYVAKVSADPTFNTNTTIFSLPTQPLSFIVPNLVAGSNYFVSVAAETALGRGGYAASTPLAMSPSAPASAPTNLVSTALNSSAVRFQWSAPQVTGILGFNVLACRFVNNALPPGPCSQYLVKDSINAINLVLPSPQMVLSVAAVNGAGVGASATLSVALAQGQPGVVGDARLFVASASSLRVTFVAPTVSGDTAISQYLVEASQSPTFSNAVSVVLGSVPRVPDFTTPLDGMLHPNLFSTDITGLTVNAVHYVRVSACNSKGCGATLPTSPATATPAPVSLGAKHVGRKMQGYQGFREVVISTQYIADWNCQNGVTYSDVPTPYNTIADWMTIKNANNEVFRSLVRFDQLGSQLPAGAVIVHAALTANVQFWGSASGCPITGYYLSKNWSWDQTDVAGQCNRIGWANSDKTHAWTIPGALGDVIPGLQFTLDSFDGASAYKQVTLDTNTVNQWLQNPASNFGLILSTSPAGCSLQVSSDIVLSVVYSVGSTISSASVPQQTLPANKIWHPRYISVAPGGSDVTGVGLNELPVRTVVRALTDALPFDSILLSSGVYAGGLGISVPHITLQSLPGQWAVIASPYTHPDVVNTITIRDSGSYARLSRLEIVGGYYYNIMLYSTWEEYGVPVRPLYVSISHLA